MDQYQQYFEANKKHLYEELFAYLRFPSIATDSHYKEDVRACAVWVKNYLDSIGFKTETWETENAPIIFGEVEIDPKMPTLLLYGHYDVQPIDPLDLWITPPFEPVFRDDAIYARGAVDNKGQSFYTFAALKAIKEIHGTFPVNVKILIEGEEESGSSGLNELLQTHKERLGADHLLIVDSGFKKKDEPLVTMGSRGIIAMTVNCQGANSDMHSGLMGGAVLNPNHVMADLISALHDHEGHVAISGFYDEVTELTPNEKDLFDFSLDTQQMQEDFGTEPYGVEKGVTPGEAVSVRPTLEINGISGGYSGEGVKTVIPAKGFFKITCRLVPHQKPQRIINLVRDYLVSKAPKGIQLDIQVHPGEGSGYRANPNHPLAQMMKKSYEKIFDNPCHFVLMGGSIPIAPALGEIAGTDPIIVGLCLPSDKIHAPNEHFGLDRLMQGYLSICYCFEQLHQSL